MADDDLVLVQRYRGGPLSALLVMRIFAQRNGPAAPITTGWIKRQSGYSQDVVADSLARLADDGLAIQVGRNLWRLTRSGLSVMGTAISTPIFSGGVAPTTTTEYINVQPVDNSGARDGDSAFFAESILTNVHGGNGHNQDDIGHISGDRGVDATGRAVFVDATARALAKMGGITYHEAAADVEIALSNGDTQADIALQVKRWAAWIATQPGADLAVMGRSISTNIRNGDLCEVDV